MERERKGRDCPLRGICPTEWYDFTLGANGKMMDHNCPMRIAISSGVHSKETDDFIEKTLAKAKGKDYD